MNNILYLGPQGSYSHIITKRMFSEKEFRFVPCISFSEIVDKVTKTNAIGILPIENSITSNVHENIDFLFNNDIVIVKEGYLKISLCLIAVKNSSLNTIKKVYSHYKVFEQCKQYIRKHLFETVEAKSSADAKKFILEKNDPLYAFIGSKELANDPGLSIVSKEIADVKYNLTRFVCVAKKNSADSDGSPKKISLVCTIAHRPGTLARLLGAFAQLGINLVMIESRPIPGSNWEYQFWIDMDTSTSLVEERKIYAAISANTLTCEIKGIYEKGSLFES